MKLCTVLLALFFTLLAVHLSSAIETRAKFLPRYHAQAITGEKRGTVSLTKLVHSIAGAASFPSGGACALTTDKTCPENFAEGLYRGTKEPDNKPPKEPPLEGEEKKRLGQMVSQMLFSHKTHRSMVAGRTSVQQTHGNSLPLRKVVGNQKPATVPLHDNAGVKNSRKDLYSYSSGEQVRNKILAQSSQYFCGAIHHPLSKVGGLYAGVGFHMLGDTYSRSHVARKKGKGKSKKERCAANEISWIYSMDTVLWRRHILGDVGWYTWEFDCLRRMSSRILNVLLAARKAAKKKSTDIQAVANTAQLKIARILCTEGLRMSGEVLRGPAGGAPAYWSSSRRTPRPSSTFSKALAVAAGYTHEKVAPMGLTSDANFKDMVKTIDQDVTSANIGPHFWYPPRGEDWCSLGDEELEALLACNDKLVLVDGTRVDEQKYYKSQKYETFDWMLPPRARDYGWVEKHTVSEGFKHFTDESDIDASAAMAQNAATDNEKDESLLAWIPSWTATLWKEVKAAVSSVATKKQK